MKLRANVRPQWQWAKLKQLLAIVLMFWGTISMYGQSKMISGIVQSESDGEPLVGATVIVKETKAGGTTGFGLFYYNGGSYKWFTVRF